MTKEEFSNKMDELTEQMHKLFVEFMTEENKKVYAKDKVNDPGKIIQLQASFSMQSTDNESEIKDVIVSWDLYGEEPNRMYRIKFIEHEDEFHDCY